MFPISLCCSTLYIFFNPTLSILRCTVYCISSFSCYVVCCLICAGNNVNMITSSYSWFFSFCLWLSCSSCLYWLYGRCSNAAIQCNTMQSKLPCDHIFETNEKTRQCVDAYHRLIDLIPCLFVPWYVQFNLTSASASILVLLLDILCDFSHHLLYTFYRLYHYPDIYLWCFYYLSSFISLLCFICPLISHEFHGQECADE
jgi:hypothetical protein